MTVQILHKQDRGRLLVSGKLLLMLMFDIVTVASRLFQVNAGIPVENTSAVGAGQEPVISLVIFFCLKIQLIL